MRCKQNDLAFIVAGAGSKFKPEPENVGRIVRCVRIVPIADMGPVWQVAAEGSPLFVVWSATERDRESTALIEDSNLRPIPSAEQRRETELHHQDSPR